MTAPVPAKDSKSAFTVISAFCLVVALTGICFLPDLKNGFLDWDDYGYILENVKITSVSLETIRWAFFEFYCNYWAPLTWLSFAVDYAFWGWNPVGYHFTNNLLHALNSGIFFLICFRLLQQYLAVRPTVNAPAPLLNSANILYCSLLAALLYAFHPLRVESVAWATERKDVLSMFFGLLAVLAYLRHARSLRLHCDAPVPAASFISSACYWLMVACYTLSLLSKALLITLPAVLLVLDWFPLKRICRTTIQSVLLEKVPLIILACLASAITMQAMAVSSRSFTEITMFTRVLIASKSLAAYLWLTLWPAHISPVYMHPGNISQADLEYVVSGFVIIVVTIICAVTVKRQPVFLAVWLLFLITLFPVLGITQNGPQAMAARFTYLPGMPVSLLAALGITTIMGKLSAVPRFVIFFKLGVLALLVWYAVLVTRDIGFWKDDVTLWNRVIELQPNTIGRSYYQRALAYTVRGDYNNALRDINVAFSIAESKKYRGLHEIHAARARIFKGLGEVDAALAEYGKAITSAPPPVPRNYYLERAALWKSQGMIEQADSDLRNAEGRTN